MLNTLMEEPVRIPFLALLLWSSFVFALMPSSPEEDAGFTRLPDGGQLSDLVSNGAGLALIHGVGDTFGMNERTKYLVLKTATQMAPDHAVQWALMNLDTHQVLQKSQNAGRRMYGASVAKIFTGGALMAKQNGKFSARRQKQQMVDMLVISSNSDWMDLQKQIGDGNADWGRERTQEFTDDLQLTNTRPYAGYWNGIHGNELNAIDLTEFLYDTYHAAYPGAEWVWKLMYTSRAGDAGALKYLPVSQYAGGKAGVYDGPTSNPDTGSGKNPDGSNYTVAVRNHMIVFNKNGHQYALAVMANTGTFEAAELLAGGLYSEVP